MNNVRFDQYLLLTCDLKKIKMVSPYDQSFHATYLTCALYLSDLEIQFGNTCVHMFSKMIRQFIVFDKRLKN